jgi:hypothetical protein
MIRPGSASKYFDISDLRAALDVERSHIARGVIKKQDSGAHWEIVTGDEPAILVEVELVPSREEITCSLLMASGYWIIPDVGDEVLVAIPDGSKDWSPFIIGALPRRNPPSRSQPGRLIIHAQDRIEITAPEIFISSDGVTGEPLCRKSDFDNHVHPTGTGPSGTPNNAATSGTRVGRME